MAYSPTTWENKPSTVSPISAENLNKIEQGISDVDARVTVLESAGGSTGGAPDATGQAAGMVPVTDGAGGWTWVELGPQIHVETTAPVDTSMVWVDTSGA